MTPQLLERHKRTEAEQAAEPTQPTKGKGKAQGKAAKPKPAPQPGRWLDRDCNAALNMQRIGESSKAPKLVPAEEKWLVSMVKGSQEQGQVTKLALLAAVGTIAKARERRDEPPPFGGATPSKKWFSAFMGRHGLTLRKASPLTKARRAAAQKREALEEWFDSKLMPTLKKTCCRGHRYLQRPDRVFNADETGFQPLSGQKVVAERGAKHVFLAAAANAKQSLTCVAWGSADGQVLAPNYISAGTMLTADALGGVAFFPDSAIILKPGTHMMDGQLFPKLLVSMARQIPGGVSKRNRALLLLDGHGSRFSSETRDTAAALGFDMLIFPGQCTHFLQPWDQLFSSVKASHGKMVAGAAFHAGAEGFSPKLPQRISMVHSALHLSKQMLEAAAASIKSGKQTTTHAAWKVQAAVRRSATAQPLLYDRAVDRFYSKHELGGLLAVLMLQGLLRLGQPKRQSVRLSGLSASAEHESSPEDHAELVLTDDRDESWRSGRHATPGSPVCLDVQLGEAGAFVDHVELVPYQVPTPAVTHHRVYLDNQLVADLQEATARLNAHRVMFKKKRKGTDKHKKGPPKKPKGARPQVRVHRSVSLSSRQATTGASGWLAHMPTSGPLPPSPCVSPHCLCPRIVSWPVKVACQSGDCACPQVIKVPEGAVLRGCKKTKRKLRQHLQLRAEVHSQLRVIASLFVLRIFLTCLVGYPTPGYACAPTPPTLQPPQAPNAPPLSPLPPRAPAQPAPAQPASMESDSDHDSEADCDSEPESQSDSESEPELEPVTQPTPRRSSARLAALAPAAPTGPPVPLDCEDPVMLRQLKDFCEVLANPNFKTVYNQLQRRLVRPRQHRNPMLMPVFEDPSNQALLAKLQELCNINLIAVLSACPKIDILNSCDFATCEARRTSTLRHTVVCGTCNAQQQSEHVLLLACGRDDGSRDDWIPLLALGAAAGAGAIPSALLQERFVKLYAKAARARLGWSGEEAQLFIKMACGYGTNAQSSELQAATLANKHCRLLSMKQQGSLQDTLPLPCRMHMC
ncbi:hypothetical protein QJQ45_022409 [Haematococcus lacustris]|nr:hypothetical protein QJQ45_022409 [Haematococcus lacustris]